MNMMQFWLVLLPKCTAASSTRLCFCLALIHCLTAAHEALNSLVSASQLPNCLRASLTPSLKFKAGSARRCCMQVFSLSLISCDFCKRWTKQCSAKQDLVQTMQYFYSFSGVRALFGGSMLSYQHATWQSLQRAAQLKQGEEG